MELILIGNNLREYGILDPTTFECEVGEGNASNTFEITGYDTLTGGVYIPGTEYGGFIERIKTLHFFSNSSKLNSFSIIILFHIKKDFSSDFIL